MKCATFEATLQPRGASQQSVDETPVSESHSQHTFNAQDPNLQGTAQAAPFIQFSKPEASPSSTDSRQPEATPTSRLSSSPCCYPTFKAGVVQNVGKALPPPPPMMPGGMPAPPMMPGRGCAVGVASSPMGGMSPPAGGGTTTFAIGNAASPASSTPPRRGNSATFDAYSPMRTPSGPASSPSSRRASLGDNDRNAGTRSAPVEGSPSRRRTSAKDKPNASASRIDPEMVPRPVGQAEAAKEEGGKVYETNKYHVPPPATVACTIVDKGSCSCEFIRATVNQVPAYPSTANTAHVPVAVACQPFAEITSREEPVLCVNLGESGPFRCTRCKAYVNPHFTWLSNGKEATCNFCSHRIEVPDEYMCPLDDKGRRKDADERPELYRGTVDYIAPRDYSDTLPGVPVVCFVIETSQRSMQTGLCPQVLLTLRSLVGFMKAPASRIAIITFDQVLQFFPVYPGGDSARMVTMSDIEDPFVPCSPEALCINVDDDAYRGQVEAMLEALPGQLAQQASSTSDQVAGGAALKAAVELVGAAGGGHVIMFHATLPNTGLGALRQRDDFKLCAKPEEGGLFTPQQAPFFDGIATDCLAKGVAVSVFCAPPIGVYVDIASLTVVPRKTGGEICHIPGFDLTVDGERLHYDISRAVVQGAVYSCVFKLRCSKGLAVESVYSYWEPDVIDQSTFHVSRLSVDATANFVVSHSERIEGLKHVYVQVACLHTDRRGMRLIRVHTLQLPVTSSLSNVFRYTEIDAVTNLLLKQAATSALSGNGSFKDKLVKSCVDMLHAYRVNCASMTSAGQLILPESLKLLPLYVGSIRKMAAFRSGSDIRVDDRLAALLRILSLPISQTAPLIYPRMYTLNPLPERAGCPTGVGDNVLMPPTIACSSDKLASDRVYLVDNGCFLRIYVREEVSLETLQNTFGVDCAADVPAALLGRPFEDLSSDAQRLLEVVEQIRRERTSGGSRFPFQPTSVVISGTPEEARLLTTFCEDRVAGEMNYVDFLCHVHKMVQNKTD